jgi:Mrp family chromosome partitioning ATPase
MAQLVEELKNRYSTRLVLFDMPSVLFDGRRTGVFSHVDAVLLVAEEGRT